jgi:hypothetical protein
MPDPDTQVQAEPGESTASEQTTPQTPQATHAEVGAPYEGLLQQAAEEHPYVPGEETIIPPPETAGAPISGVPTPEPGQTEQKPD